MTAPSTPDLAARILAAIAELENAGREAKWNGEWRSTRNNDMPLVCADVALVNSEGEFLEYVATDVERSTAVHIALHDPEAEQRRCAADRRILRAHRTAVYKYLPGLGQLYSCESCHRFTDEGTSRSWCETILAMAEGYGITVETS